MPPKRRRQSTTNNSNGLPTQGTTAAIAIGADANNNNNNNNNNNSSRKPAYGPAQDAFVQATRRAIDAGELQSLHFNWKCIRPSLAPNNSSNTKSNNNNNNNKTSYNNTKYPVDYYYVRPIAVWVPHLIIPNFIPYCPHCKSPDGIDLAKLKRTGHKGWATNPKLLMGVQSHRYLDTKVYYCNPCSRQFLGTHPGSLRLGHSRLLGQFNFHLPNGANYAMDEDLYRFITALARTPVVQIVHQLTNRVKEQYNQDAVRYLLDARDGRVMPLASSKQNAAVRIEETPAAKRRKQFQNHPQYATLLTLMEELTKAEALAKDDIDFVHLLQLKNGRNNVKLDLPALGRAKLDSIMAVGITTARQFLQAADSNNEQYRALKKSAKRSSTVDVWATLVRDCLEGREKKFNDLDTQIRELEEVIGISDNDDILNTSATTNDESDNATTATTAATPTEPVKYASFSSMEDKNGYNAKFVLPKTIKDVLADDFHQRQCHVYLGRMLQLGGDWLRLHFVYSVGQKVISNQPGVAGLSYPYKCMAVILNERGHVIWWAMIKNDGSIDDIIVPLKKLKARLDRRGDAVNSIFAEDVQVVHKLQKVFDMVTLDVYDWIKLWNKILLSKPDSVIAWTFRALMCKAVLGISVEQFKQAKRHAKTRFLREPTIKEVMRECQVSMPTPESQETNATDVLYYFYYSDIQQAVTGSQTKINNMMGPATKIFASYDLVVKTATEQFSVLKKSILSDQESATAKREISELVEIINREAFTGNRGCGVRRAERVIWSVLDEWNTKLLEQGEAAQQQEDAPSAMALKANAIAEQMGMEPPKLQVVDSNYTNKTTETELLGFDLASDEAENGTGVDFEDYLDTMVHDIEHGESSGNGPLLPIMPEVTHQPAVDPHSEDPLINEIRAKTISRHSRGLERFLADAERANGQTSLQAFKSLAFTENWAKFLDCTPFKCIVSGEQISTFDKEERTVYLEMQKLGFDSNSLESYKLFEKAWNFEVGKRMRGRFNGESDEILIHRKTVDHLFAQHDLSVVRTIRITDGLDRAILFKNCVNCGFEKRKHHQEERFGSKCLRDYCARCGALKKWHDEYGSKMGFYCSLTATQTGMSGLKIIEFDDKWRKTNLVTDEASELARYVPKKTRLIRQPAPSNLVLPIRENSSDLLPDLFKLDKEPFSVSIVRAMEERFIDEDKEIVYSPLRLWTKELRELPPHSMTGVTMVKMHEWSKAYFAIRFLRALEFGVQDSVRTLSAFVKAKPRGREEWFWLDIAMEAVNRKLYINAAGPKVIDLSAAGTAPAPG